jgi:GrpB-like predicted nucleotidyltransferase (UPF0157 family)
MPDTIRPIIGPYPSHSAACRDYDARAVVVAGRIADCISSHLPKIRVEHVGSTSVPGCAGKGIVDLMIAVHDGEMAAVKEALAGLGFQHQTNCDPFPEDRPMRVGSVVHDGETFLLHVHVIPADSPEIEEMRFFRACLRADPELLNAYVARKREIIAGGVTDSLEYCKIKGKFIQQVLG